MCEYMYNAWWSLSCGPFGVLAYYEWRDVIMKLYGLTGNSFIGQLWWCHLLSSEQHGPTEENKFWINSRSCCALQNLICVFNQYWAIFVKITTGPLMLMPSTLRKEGWVRISDGSGKIPAFMSLYSNDLGWNTVSVNLDWSGHLPSTGPIK